MMIGLHFYGSYGASAQYSFSPLINTEKRSSFHYKVDGHQNKVLKQKTPQSRRIELEPGNQPAALVIDRREVERPGSVAQNGKHQSFLGNYLVNHQPGDVTMPGWGHPYYISSLQILPLGMNAFGIVKIQSKNTFQPIV